MYVSPDCYRMYKRLFNNFNEFVEEKLTGNNDYIRPIVYVEDAYQIYEECSKLIGMIDILLPSLKENSTKIASYEDDKANLLSIKEAALKILKELSS